MNTNLFETKIFKYNSSSKNKILDYINQIKFNNHKLVEQGLSTYDFILEYQKYPFLSNIVKKFKKEAGKDYYLLDLWCNVYNKNGYVKEHNHHDTCNNMLKNIPQISGVYNIKKPVNSGDLILDGHKTNLKEDECILFDSRINHSSTPNLSEDTRIIFSINMAYKVERKWNEDYTNSHFLNHI